MATQFTDSNIRFIERFVEHYIAAEKKPKQAAMLLMKFAKEILTQGDQMRQAQDDPRASSETLLGRV
jgi:hypothetical protein